MTKITQSDREAAAWGKDLPPNWSPEKEAKFWAKVDRRGPDDCWEWQGWKNSHNYGVFTLGADKFTTHRISAALAGKEIVGVAVRHKCDNPPCVNPSHLECGTIADNNRDMRIRGRDRGSPAINALKTHCWRGHLLAGENLRIDNRGYRRCKACRPFDKVKMRARRRGTRLREQIRKRRDQQAGENK